MLNHDKRTDAAQEALPKPTIAALHSACSSGCLEWALGFTTYEPDLAGPEGPRIRMPTGLMQITSP
jgi:hypothetical protein